MAIKALCSSRPNISFRNFDFFAAKIAELQSWGISFFECDSLYPPFVFTEETKETIVDDLCAIIVDRISEAQNNG